MQVELSSIIEKYRELLATKTHEAVCYQLAVKKLEEENRRLQTENDTLNEALEAIKPAESE